LAAPAADRQSGVRWRPTLEQSLLGILLLALAGTLLELVLLEHYEDWQQWVPLAALCASVITLTWHGVRPSVSSRRVVRLLMLGLIVAGVAGVVLHVQGNLEFEQELNPGMSGFALWIEVFRGATPALAPGSLVPFGLLGLLYLSRRSSPSP
jgi:hypothetical protein